jgi:hypothetical protein
MPSRRAISAADLSSEMDRRIRERACGPYSRYFNATTPRPVLLSQRDSHGCNWTVVAQPTLRPEAAGFIDLVVSRLRFEYDLLPG